MHALGTQPIVSSCRGTPMRATGGGVQGGRGTGWVEQLPSGPSDDQTAERAREQGGWAWGCRRTCGCARARGLSITSQPACPFHKSQQTHWRCPLTSTDHLGVGLQQQLGRHHRSSGCTAGPQCRFYRGTLLCVRCVRACSMCARVCKHASRCACSHDACSPNNAPATMPSCCVPPNVCTVQVCQHRCGGFEFYTRGNPSPTGWLQAEEIFFSL